VTLGFSRSSRQVPGPSPSSAPVADRKEPLLPGDGAVGGSWLTLAGSTRAAISATARTAPTSSARTRLATAITQAAVTRPLPVFAPPELRMLFVAWRARIIATIAGTTGQTRKEAIAAMSAPTAYPSVVGCGPYGGGPP
jgi:hypothetical protein